MNKGGGGVGHSGGGGGGVQGNTGPTSAAYAAAAQKQKNLLQRVDNDINNIVDNFSYLVNVARVNDPPVRNSQEAFMMEMRAARMDTNNNCSFKLITLLNHFILYVKLCENYISTEMKTGSGGRHTSKVGFRAEADSYFSGFASLNEHVEQRTIEFNQQVERTDRMLARIGEEAAASLKELESHYYSSIQRTNKFETGDK
ncbi:hypothetical protein IFM89_024437 [Coptis chinensis]|uniref:Uncharacterized protein n=1 Tax=Coptis chinensis TaxID=261450 RepID=A0A835HGT2_9MAGN|nr:hypothetical protein IFM89_024437 [Coptis chinensis]